MSISVNVHPDKDDVFTVVWLEEATINRFLVLRLGGLTIFPRDIEQLRSLRDLCTFAIEAEEARNLPACPDPLPSTIGEFQDD